MERRKPEGKKISKGRKEKLESMRENEGGSARGKADGEDSLKRNEYQSRIRGDDGTTSDQTLLARVREARWLLRKQAHQPNVMP